MPTVVQLRRGTTAQNTAFTGAAGELTFDTTLGTLRVHDNSTAGGNVLVAVTATQTLTNKTIPVIAGVTTITGNLVANSATASTSTTTGALVVVGGVGVSGAIYAGSIQNTPIGSTTASTGNFSTLNTTGTHTAATINAGTIGNIGANVIGTGTYLTSLTGSNVNGTVTTANVSLYDSYAATTTNATFYPQLADKTAGNGSIFTASTLTHNPSTGALTATSFNGVGTFSTATTSSTLIASGNVVAASGTASSSTTTGALVVVGGTGISGAVYAGSVYDNGTRVVSTSSGAGNLTISAGAITLPATGPGATTVGGSTAIPIITTDAYGRVVTLSTASLSTTSISNGTSNVAVASGGGISFGIASANVVVVGATGIVPNSNVSYNLGDTTHWFNTFYGLATQAKYADLAENYNADTVYDPGTVLVFGGTNEVTTTITEHDTRVAGVVSTNPAHLMNGGLQGETVVALGLTGRLPCKVLGPVNTGDVLVTSNVPGVAKRIDNSKFLPGCVVGKALQSILIDEIELIEIVVGRF